MSLVNWRRWKRHDTERANAWASVVLPTPGTSSISRWPRASRQTRDSLTTSGLPRIADPRTTSSPASLARSCGENPAGGATIDSRWDILLHHIRWRVMAEPFPLGAPKSQPDVLVLQALFSRHLGS